MMVVHLLVKLNPITFVQLNMIILSLKILHSVKVFAVMVKWYLVRFAMMEI